MCADDKSLAPRTEKIASYGVKVFRTKKTAAWQDAERTALSHLPTNSLGDGGSLALASVQEFVPSELLMGLLPGALLDAYDFWRCGGGHTGGVLWGE